MYLSQTIMTDSNLRVITDITPDPPRGSVNWCTISFLTPQKIESLANIQVTAFKLHNGYNTEEIARQDADEIRNSDDRYDVFVLQLGKIYPWDDSTRTESVDYKDKKLTTMDEKRRENADKARLISQQFANELTIDTNTNNRSKAIRERLRKKLYQQNKISKTDLDKLETARRERAKYTISPEMWVEIEKSMDTDYLTVNPLVGLEYGLISIYSPENIGGLNVRCFKIRALCADQQELEEAKRFFTKKYPHDSIGTFKVGEWCCVPLTNDVHEPIKQLNYSMKVYIDALEEEEVKFQERKRKAEANARNTTPNTTPTDDTTVDSKKNKRKKKRSKRKPTKKQSPPKDMVGTQEDKEAIEQIFDFIHDPELANIYAVDEADKQTISLDM